MKSTDERPEDEFNRLVRQLASTRTEPQGDRAGGLGARPLGQGLRQVLQRVAAALRFDSKTTPAPAAGLRGTLAETRHLLFSAKGRDIDLRLAPAAHGFELNGQILGPDEGGQVALAAHVRPSSRPPPPTRHAVIDTLGEFHLEGIDEGTYVLTLQLGHDEIVLPPIDMGARS